MTYGIEYITRHSVPSSGGYVSITIPFEPEGAEWEILSFTARPGSGIRGQLALCIVYYEAKVTQNISMNNYYFSGYVNYTHYAHSQKVRKIKGRGDLKMLMTAQDSGTSFNAAFDISIRRIK